MKHILLGCLIISTIILPAQNLVINPSFENTATNCSQLGGEGFRSDLSASWDNANSNVPGDSCSSPDLFSACNIALGIVTPTHMPDGGSLALGYQWSHTGTRHAGFILYEAPFGIQDEYREYIQGRLSSPLTAGQTYCVSMYVSLADYVGFATNNIGVYFGNVQYMRDACVDGASIYNLTPQLNYGCSPITDTSESWVRLQWDYVAAGGEKWMLIGNFHNSASTTKVSTGRGGAQNPYAYYFIDDVSVVPGSCCAADITPVSTLCVTDAPFNLTAQAPLSSACTAPSLNGTWSGPGITNASNGTFSPSAAGAGTHTVTFTLSCGTAVNTTITVNACSALTVCRETNGTYTVSGGTAPYTWSQWNSASTISITNQATCTACGFTWSAFPVAQCGFPVPNTSCTLPAGYVQYATGTNTPAPTSYPIRITDNSGGSLTVNSAAVVQACGSTPNCPIITLSRTNPTCAGSVNNGSITFSFTGGTAPYTITIDTGGTPVTVTVPTNPSPYTVSNMRAGTTSIIIQDASGCSVDTTVVLTAPNCCMINLSVTASQPTCGQANGGLTVTATPAGTYTYAWSGGLPNQASQSNLAAGTYRLTITNTSIAGCNKDTVLTLNSGNGVSVALLNPISPTCAGYDGSVTFTLSGGTAPYVLTVDTNGNTFTVNLPVNPGPQTISNLGGGTITVSVADGAGCTANTSATLTAPTNCCVLSIGSLTITQPNCGMTDGIIQLSAASGSGNYSYQWGDGTTGNILSNIGTGAYIVTITDNVQGCAMDTLILLTNSNSPSINSITSSNETCAGASDGSATVSASGGAAPYSYAWSNGQTASTATNLSSGNYLVTITDTSGCQTIGSVNVNANSCCTLTSSTIVTNSSCGLANGIITVNISTAGTAPYSYSIDGISFQSSNVFSGLAAGSYTVTTRDFNNCEHTITVSILSSPNPLIDLGDDIRLCGNQSVIIDAGANFSSYHWSTGDTTSSITPQRTGLYTLTVSDQGGCSATDNIFVIFYPAPTIELEDSMGAKIGDAIVLNPVITPTPNSLSRYTWQPSSQVSCASCQSVKVEVKDSSSRTYTLSYIDQYGCETTESVTVFVFPSGSVYFPNAFSPNGDGVNDLYQPFGRGIENISYAVFNRWGEKVFEGTTSSYTWDGTYKEEIQPNGVYLYAATVVFLNGTSSNLKGSISLIR